MGVDKNEFFRQAVIRICGSLDIETAMERCFRYIKGFLPVDQMSLDLLDIELDMVRFIATVSSEGWDDFGKTVQLPQEGRAERAAKWAHGEKLKIINQPDTHPDIKTVFEKLGKSLDVSMMFMHLELEGKRVGALSLMAEGTGRYKEEHGALVLLLNEPFAVAMVNAMKHQEVLKLKDMLADDNRYLQRELRQLSGAEIVGADFGLKGVMELVRQVAPLDSPVLLLGETGAGKEVIATAIHYSSSRKEGPFIKVNCGAIPENLVDSELFGHEKGAFTGAISQKRGRFERANHGTIFLDEIGELPLQAQVRLLHVLQNRQIERVGGTKSIPVDIRIVSATHRNLEEMIRSGQFREDLWFRLNVFPIMIPPLRQRKEDIPALVHHFIERKCIDLRLHERPRLGAGVLEQLMAYDWPGNVRELENVVERAMIRRPHGPLGFDHLVMTGDPVYEKVKTEGQNGAMATLNEMNARHILQALEMSKGKVNGPGGAAEMLDIHPNTLRKRMDKLGVAYGHRRRDSSGA
ncbi:MAG: sigma 54-interacting transcriptional regulator [Thermodesulfobacteriota bacterium]|nr:sigma 54-interacting transcriptional regulator [Thermodesulfobacteriota bacterium]